MTTTKPQSQLPAPSQPSSAQLWGSSQKAQVAPVIVPNMIYNPDPRARAKVHSTQASVPAYFTPKFGGPQFTALRRNKRYPIIGKSADGQWWQVLADGIPAWVSASSIARFKSENVPVTQIADGGVPAAQEVYFRYVLGIHRDELKRKPTRSLFNTEFLNATQWSDQQRVVIPSDKLDPEYLSPAEGGVGSLERQIRNSTPEYKRTIGLLVIGYFALMIVPSLLSPTLVGVSALMAMTIPLLIWAFHAYMSRGFLHNKFHTKTQRDVAQMKQYAAIAAGVAATAAAGYVAYSANKSKTSSGSKADSGSGLAALANLVKEAAPVAAKAAPLVAAAGSVYLGKKVIENVQEGQIIEAQSVPVLPLHTFISYRRVDTEPVAAWLHQELTKVFAQGAIFLDHAELVAGHDFRQQLQQRLSSSKIVLVLIGPKWLETLQERIDNGQPDFVRGEVALALEKGLTVIPVLLKSDDAIVPMPRESDLPSNIRELANRHAVTLDLKHPNVSVLAERIKAELGQHIKALGGATS